MKKKNVRGRVFIILGAVLIIGALSLVLYNLNREKQSEKAVAEIYSKLSKKIPKLSDEENAAVIEPSDGENLVDETLDIDGNLYIGMISIPALGKELPVMKDWSYANLNIAPSRYSGSICGNDIIIAVHNYNCYFGTMESLQTGDEIIFTAVSGKKYYYEISYFELISGWNSNSLIDDSNNDWDLTLFTCNWSGYSRVVIRCILQ